MFVSAISIAQTTSLEFHNGIVAKQSRIDAAVSRFNAGIVLFDGDTILSAYKNMLTVTESVISETEKMKVPESGTEYHKAALDLFRFYLRTFENDYYDAVAIMYRIPVTDADIEEMERLFDRIELKGGKVAAEHRLLEGIGRVRDVRQGPDGGEAFWRGGSDRSALYAHPVRRALRHGGHTCGFDGCQRWHVRQGQRQVVPRPLRQVLRPRRRQLFVRASRRERA